MNAITRNVTTEAARDALAAGDLRRAAELYAALQLEDELRDAEAVGGVQ